MATPATSPQALRFADVFYPIAFLVTWLLILSIAGFSYFHGDGSMSPFLWILLGTALAFSYSFCLRSKPLEILGWSQPHHWFYWLVAPVLGFAAGCGYAYLVRYYDLLPSPIDRSLAFRSMALTAGPILEEIIFRCAILGCFLLLLRRTKLPPIAVNWLGNFATAALFALWHPPYTPLLLSDAMVCGLVFGWLRLRSGSVAVAAVAHAAVNTAVIFITPLLVY